MNNNPKIENLAKYIVFILGLALVSVGVYSIIPLVPFKTAIILLVILIFYIVSRVTVFCFEKSRLA